MNKNNRRKTYPCVVIKKTVILPYERVSLILEGKEIIETVQGAFQNDQLIFLLFQKNYSQSPIGVVARILQSWYFNPYMIGIAVEGVERARTVNVFIEKGIRKAETEPAGETTGEEIGLAALARSALDQFKKLIQLKGVIPFIAASELMQREQIPPGQLSDLLAASVRMNFAEKLEFLETLDIKKRLEILDKKLTKELSIAEIKMKIQQTVEKKISKEQRELTLREQLRAIEQELGILKEEKEFSETEKKVKAIGMPKPVEQRTLKELHRLRSMPALSAEAPYIRAYLDWLTELPWSKKSAVKMDLKKAKNVLDEDHYGLEKAKERVLEYLAVQKLTKGKGRGTIMCFVGPPGTGKTSVGKSIARALGRSFVRISLGGIRDEAEIRGHRRTYVGALPGRIIQGMRNAGAKNPVFMMDEIDKIGADFRGDPSAALLEALDPEQNGAFSDHYLEVPFDLSEVFFITTANILDTIPPALRDRMEVIEFPGYTDDEKFHIAKVFLIPKILKAHGLDGRRFAVGDAAVKKIIGKYTHEAGVRNLERKLAETARKAAKKMVEKKIKKKISVEENNLLEYLGPEEYRVTMREAKDEVGIATGLAWTPAGGEIIFIETIVMPGKGSLTLTGQLGEMMQESAKAALSYLRSRHKEFRVPRDFHQNFDVHIHVPSGAIPKDGPSAGIAIAAALASTLTKRQVKKEVALTGEITLSGKVLEIGGVKEKVLAAHRAGVETVVLPKDNEKNLVDIPASVREKLKFKFVSHIDEALKIALK